MNITGEMMESYEILSHLTKKDWKRSWEKKVVQDTKENLRNYHSKSCFFGHFVNKDDFILYYHKEFEGNSLNTYFHGRVEKCPEGCRVTGTFKKKRTANIFLVFAAILTLMTTLVMAFNNNFQMMTAPAGLFVIVVLCYCILPKSSRERLMEELKDISFADMPKSKNSDKELEKEEAYSSISSITKIKTAEIEKTLPDKDDRKGQEENDH